MPLFTLETMTIGFKMFVVVVCSVVAIVTIGIVVETMQPIGEATGVGSQTTPIYKWIPQVIGIICVITAATVIIGYFLAAHRKEHETYYREQNNYLYRR